MSRFSYSSSAPEDGNCLPVLPGRLPTSSSWSFCGRGPKEGERFPNRPRAPRHPSLLGISNPGVEKAVDSGLEEEGMLSEYQELSLLSVVSGTSRPIRQLTWKDGVGGKSDGSWANELDVGKLFPENGLVME